MHKIVKFLLTVGLALLLPVQALTADTDKVRVHMQTSMGDIVLELDKARAPITVKNFLSYAQSGFYEGTIFHRVIDGFMIQGGGYDEHYNKKPTRPPIINEANNGLQNLRGTISMARTGVIHSATSQFFINVKDNPSLDHRGPTPRGFGYAVFGQVVEGMDVVDKIRQVATGADTPLPSRDVPLTAVLIKKVTVE
ncbi:peptidylprolyl isomerase [Sulfuriflexus sp.]|uniref:peptidylprolyl isomerase n=1 Tax=Sulfuriflexus sp. TaxID=2015443 RepID=UPI00391F3DEB